MSRNVGEETAEVQELARVLKELAGEIMKHSARDTVCLIRNKNLSMPQVAAMMYLRRLGTGSISDLSHYLNLSLAATSHLVERLVVLGYVSRIEDPHDRRHKQVTLTEAGAAMVEEIQQARVEETARKLSYLPLPFRQTVLDTLTQMTAYLRGDESMTTETSDQPVETSAQQV